ncbi:DUF1910 domain-containing protein, partial [Campylobacter sp. W0018]|nr:DUF1910 domain-containing protein [Campylobacter sp. W0018]
MLRDTSKDEACFTEEIIKCEEEIEERKRWLLELPLEDPRREHYLFCIEDRKFHLAMRKYARGDDINLVKKDLEEVISIRQEKRLEFG